MEKVVGASARRCPRTPEGPPGLSEGGAGGLGVAAVRCRCYQQQAQHPTITSSPSGDGPDLAKLDLPAADGIMLLAAHISRHGTLTEWLDASILGRIRPHPERDPELDVYNPDNPNQPPYSQEFLARYRQAQISRNRRISAWVKEKLAELKADGRPDDEFGFVVHGTMADPRWLDPNVDPNEHTPGTCYLGDPQVGEHQPGSGWPASPRCAVGSRNRATTTRTAMAWTADATSRCRRW